MNFETFRLNILKSLFYTIIIKISLNGFLHILVY